MLVWTGWGILVPVIGFICALATEAATRTFTGDEAYYGEHGWLILVALFSAGVIVFFLGRYLNLRPGKHLIDTDTGEEIEQRKSHTFFFIPMQYWGFILTGFGVYAAIAV